MAQTLAAQFAETGFAIARSFLPKATAERLKQIAADDRAMSEHAYTKRDAAGRQSKVTLWYEPGEDVFGRLSCSQRLIGDMSDCLGGRAEFFHAKLMQKESKTGGAWEWHQDYGYWYDDGFLTDAMGSCYVALDPATRENGCLQIMPGTHKYGRLRHGASGEQVGADMSRVTALQERHEPIHVELDAGDAVFFHASTLHASGPNLSDASRWGLISSFFRADNESILPDRRFHSKPITPVPHTSILEGALASDRDKTFYKA